MLADYRLDTEEFSDIMEEARNMVISLYPEWTDFNYHDPGITMLEMFAWIKEGQQYFLDQIGTEHRKKYLKLLGIAPRHRRAAGTQIYVDTQTDITVLKGTKLNAKGVQFETRHGQCMTKNRITKCFHGKTQLEDICIGGDIEQNENLRLPVFGNSPKPGDTWYIGFEHPLPVQETVSIQISLAVPASGNRRRPVKAPLPVPMLRLCYEYFAQGEWQEISRCVDHTFEMLQDGILYISVAKPMQQTEVFGETAYYIRLRTEACDTDLPPVLERIRLNVLPVVQQDTWAEYEKTTAILQKDRYMASIQTYLGLTGHNDLYVEEGEIYYPVSVMEKYINEETAEARFVFPSSAYISAGGAQDTHVIRLLIVSYEDKPGMEKCLGIGTGLPDQEFELHSADVMHESVQILVHEIGSGGGFSWWTRVEDFGASTPEDRHFTVDSNEGRICFGDCEHGMAPEGEIRLVSFISTLGEEGNVKKGTIDSFLGIPSSRIQVWNDKDAEGGRNEESLEECFYRARKGLKKPDTAVTYADYEQRVKETPGLMIASCRAVPMDEMHMIQEHPKENTLSIVVKAEGMRQLTDTYRKNILAHLEKYRLLGMQIQIIAPRYVLLEVFLDITVKPHFLKAKEQISQAVEGYFSRLSKQFGAVIVYSELYGLVDMAECVASVNDMTLDIRDGKVTRTRDGNILLPPNGVLELKQVHYVLTMSD